MKILIADDHPIFRSGLKEILTDESDVELVGEAGDGHQTLALARSQRWDAMVLDITMPGKDGFQVLQELQAQDRKIPILILTAHPEEQLGLRLLRAGAAGYLTKDKAPEMLLSALRKIVKGGRYISESLAEKIALETVSAPGADGQPPHERLSDREYQVMRMMAVGKTVKDIAKELYLSPRTVSTYRARLLDKMDMKSNAEVIRYALDRKLVD